MLFPQLRPENSKIYTCLSTHTWLKVSNQIESLEVQIIKKYFLQINRGDTHHEREHTLLSSPIELRFSRITLFLVQFIIKDSSQRINPRASFNIFLLYTMQQINLIQLLRINSMQCESRFKTDTHSSLHQQFLILCVDTISSLHRYLHQSTWEKRLTAYEPIKESNGNLEFTVA